MSDEAERYLQRAEAAEELAWRLYECMSNLFLPCDLGDLECDVYVKLSPEGRRALDVMKQVKRGEV
jgi:hypothetical protein